MQRLGWGRSNPKNCTLSFWAKTSVAGTYCVSFRQGAATRSQIKEYTLSANTWTKVELTITGDSDSTWLNSDYTTNGKGILIEWNLGKSNSKNTSTVNSWISGNKVASNNQVRWIATLGATFSLTGVQLEVGSVATPFEHRSYGDTLMDCYRYYVKLYTNTSDFSFGYGYKYAATAHAVSVPLPTRMRTTPTCTFDNLRIRGGNTTGVNNSESVTSVGGMTFSHGNFQSFTASTNASSATIGHTVVLTNAVSNSTSYINFDAEL